MKKPDPVKQALAEILKPVTIDENGHRVETFSSAPPLTYSEDNPYLTVFEQLKAKGETIKELKAENARLRDILKKTNAGNTYVCPWCDRMRDMYGKTTHRRSCEVFTPEGELK